MEVVEMVAVQAATAGEESKFPGSRMDTGVDKAEGGGDGGGGGERWWKGHPVVGGMEGGGVFDGSGEDMSGEAMEVEFWGGGDGVGGVDLVVAMKSGGDVAEAEEMVEVMAIVVYPEERGGGEKAVVERVEEGKEGEGRRGWRQWHRLGEADDDLAEREAPTTRHAT
ncbi:hypothetical protein CYMTET_29477 [Cymbomonas tetramitiformis]|uniref:Uncharacterized protein n=1 Tax=Cymbomonas tetramitiformis TaxID=36881 RepID=A0AAE0FKP4_9CHLO|nr:hypothetical protein CYMTET_29477 [Cymbomonas tetramitiformis]